MVRPDEAESRALFDAAGVEVLRLPAVSRRSVEQSDFRDFSYAFYSDVLKQELSLIEVLEQG